LSKAKSILLLAALAEEADAFLEGQGRIVEREPLPVRMVETDVAQIRIVTCGLGKVNAALAVGRYADASTSLVTMTGTCGRIGAIEGDCFWIARAIQHDYGARQAEGFVHYRAGDWPMGEARDHAFSAMRDPGLGLPHASIASGDVFLECADTAEALAQRLDVHLVDMEVAAVAQATEALGLPWAAIKAVTDGADGESAGDFNANLKRAARKAAKAMERLIEEIVSN
jgi:adenosylhomocysteine nucleosidase